MDAADTAGTAADQAEARTARASRTTEGRDGADRPGPARAPGDGAPAGGAPGDGAPAGGERASEPEPPSAESPRTVRGPRRLPLPPGRARRAAAWCAGTLLLLTTVPVACRAAGVDGVTPIPQLLAFLPWLLVPAGLGLLLFAAARRPVGCAWALAVLGVTCWFVTPYGDGPAEPRGPLAARLTVLTANLEFGGATADLLETLRREQPALVSVQECDDRCAMALDSPALRQAYPYRNIVSGTPAEGSAILSTYPLTDEPGVRGTLAMPGAVAEVAGQRVRMQVAHPMPPVPGQLDLWRTELGRLRDYADRRGGLPTIVAGDFNASQDHAVFRAVLGSGMRDSARLLGADRTPTWPADTASRSVGTQIDHVLVSDAFRPRAARFLDLDGTDHRAVLVTLDLHRGTEEF
ncbi:endonuclease/exonuclease/phosphatase family protein [Streptomyces sp. NPDC004647]|uniref:endonuclease/exonuclease/phosphatase family protein n=1 Tax=Streptomyces sp. NPDC004647 TaxID=3154671 RepID=UPI0033AAA48F